MIELPRLRVDALVSPGPGTIFRLRIAPQADVRCSQGQCATGWSPKMKVRYPRKTTGKTQEHGGLIIGE